ncbi:MAG: pseudouridine-5'-phosphate glycosidase, partial [Paracoccaceae bacterium]|nr:pseudouridine-5'-phosphate glycosidase [Paracoccaceae bacterium]
MTIISYAPEVQAARETRKSIVALESTIITHGMPWPDNLKMVNAVEQCIRDEGAVPATIAVLAGRLCVGLTQQQLRQLAQTRDAAKLSRADLAACLATGGTGATTVSATMIGAAQAGISV